MSDFQLLFQLFALLLGLTIAELLSGLARSWRIKLGAVRTRETKIRIGYLVPLFAFLILSDLTRFWLTMYDLRNHLTFEYTSLLAMLLTVGGYYVISTFVFPDEPDDWPDFDEYFLKTHRTVVGGMVAVNLTVALYGAWLFAMGIPIVGAPITYNWLSLAAALIYITSLLALWLAQSKRTSLVLLLVANALLLTSALILTRL